MIPVESPCKTTYKAKVSALSDVFLKNERRDSKRGVGLSPFIDQFWRFGDILRTVQRIESSEISKDRELFSLQTSAIWNLQHVAAFYLQAIQDPNPQNSDTSISTPFDLHAQTSSGTINFIPETDRAWKMLHRTLH